MNSCIWFENDTNALELEMRWKLIYWDICSMVKRYEYQITEYQFDGFKRYEWTLQFVGFKRNERVVWWDSGGRDLKHFNAEESEFHFKRNERVIWCICHEFNAAHLMGIWIGYVWNFFLMIKEQLPDSQMSSGRGSYQHLTANAKNQKKKRNSSD